MKEYQIRVYYEDTDAQGVVYYANYLKFFERARTEFLREVGYEQMKLMEEGVIFVVRSLEMKLNRHGLSPLSACFSGEIVTIKFIGFTI